MSCGIYKITNLINNHIYIGQSKNIEERWNQEKLRAFREGSGEYEKTLYRAFRKYGIENFDFSILEICDHSELDLKEQFYVKKYNSYFNGYNETLGGNQGNSNNCVKISKQQLLEIYDLLQNSDIPQKEIAQQYNVGQDVISTINNGKSRILPGYTYPLRTKKSHKSKVCVDCGVTISVNAERCDKCAKKLRRKIQRPSREELKQMIRNLPFTKIGEYFKMTDNGIRKWCDEYGLPRKKKDINSFSDEEWDLI